MRYVGLAALAATFWLSVATLRLILREPSGPRPTCLVQHVPPAPIELPRVPLLTNPLPPVMFGPLTHAEVEAELEKLRPLIQACEDHGVPGEVHVDWRINPDGTVSLVSHQGDLAGTAAGICVTDVVQSARFHPSEAGFDAVYTFQLP